MFYRFSIREGWKEIEDFLPDDEEEFEDQVEKAGYFPAPDLRIGLDAAGFDAAVYSKDAEVADNTAPYQFLVAVSLGDEWYPVAVPALPDLIELLSKLANISHAAITTALHSNDDDDPDDEGEEDDFEE